MSSGDQDRYSAMGPGLNRTVMSICMALFSNESLSSIQNNIQQ